MGLFVSSETSLLINSARLLSGDTKLAEKGENVQAIDKNKELATKTNFIVSCLARNTDECLDDGLTQASFFFEDVNYI